MAATTKEDAEKIATKLGAKDETTKGDEHDEMVVYFEGKYWARFGISRGSKKESPHNHVHRNLNISPHFAKELAICTKSCREYFEKVGLVKPTEPTEANPLLEKPQYHWEKDWAAEQAAADAVEMARLEALTNPENSPDSPEGESSI
jgi:hypothetical protein